MQDKIKEITRQHNRLLNILLALYVTLCLIFALLWNGFFINSKALEITANNSIDFSITYNGNTGYGNYSCNATNLPSRICILNDEQILGLFEDNTFQGGTVIAYRNVGLGYGPPTPNVGYAPYVSYSFSNSAVNNKLLQFDSEYTDYMSLIWLAGQWHETTDPNSKLIQVDVLNKSEIGYVNTLDDLKAYMKNGDETKVEYSDPNNPPVVESSNIPTPQKVQILDNGENPMIVWDNPKTALKFGDKLNVEIQFKPTFSLWQDLSFTESVICRNWLEAFKGKLDNHNAFCVLKNSDSVLNNNLNGYNVIFDDNYIFDTSPVTDYAKSYIKMVIDQNGETNLVPYGVGEPPTQARNIQKKINSKSGVVGGALSDTLWETLAPEALATIKGLFNGGTVTSSNFRIRYSCKDGNKILVSPWVNASREFNDDSTPKSDTNISFSDKDDTPIQNPTYLPATTTNVTPVSSDAWWMNFNGYTGTMFENLTQQMSDWTGDTGGFVGFFGELFNEFPFLSWCLLFSLSLAIFLRIFGR